VVWEQPLLDLNRIRSAAWRLSPFRWAKVDQIFTSLETASSLRKAFPSDDYKAFVRLVGLKRHQLTGKLLSTQPRKKSALSPLWQQFCAEVYSPEYRSALQETSGILLDDLHAEITLWRHGSGCFIDPHTDNDAKKLVQLVYFSDEYWTAAQGGCLRLLRSNDIHDYEEEILPVLGTSVLFERSASSWHGYLPITGSRSLRLAAQIVFHEPSLKYSGNSERSS
jgi:SM-20-related protein